MPVHTPAWQVSVRVQAVPSSQAAPSGFAGLEHVPVAGSHEPAAWHWSAAAQTTGFVPVHVPAWQVSVRVQAVPSSQAAPSGFAGLEHVPVAGSHEPAAWHWSAAAQTTGFVPVHVPAWQVSVRVQAVPSSQAAPSGFAGLEHVPVAGSHEPAAWHWSAAAQTTGFVPVHVPAWQVSVRVQAVPSSQAAPSGFAGLEHVPVAGSHEPAAWHWSAAAQTTGFVPVHVPAWQVSVRVQAVPSSQAAPSGFAGLEHVPVAGSQVPAAWHWSAGAQTTGFVPVRVADGQVSLCVQALPSLQAAPSGFAGLEHVPVAGSQVPAAWHWSAGAQTTGFVPVHVPAWQVSLCVQALPSLQAAPSGFAGLEHVPVAGSQVPAAWHWSAGAQTTG